MHRRIFTDCVDIVGSACKQYDGEKNYISTGAVDVNYIVPSEVERFEYTDRPSRANLEVDKGDILFAKMQGTKKTLLINESLAKNVYSTGFCAVRPKEGMLIERCLYHLVSSKTFLSQKDKNCSGATQKAITNAGLGKIMIKVPEYHSQEKIVDELDKLAKVIENRKSQLEKMDELIKARFVEMFGDPKLNEKKWKTGIVSDYYAVKGGKRIPKGMGYADGVTEHPYLRASDMKNETILDDDIHYITEKVYEKIKRYTVNGGDIYITNVGVNLGMAGVIPQKYDGANLTENAVKLVPTTEKVLDGLFLSHYINSPGIQDYINERKMAVGVPKLAIFRIETIPLIIPPLKLQIEFIDFCKQVDKSKVAVQKALDEAQLLFDSLMQEYFG
ncbi:restriction endonuclease subunit S [Streptococcus ruminicola]|uniref:restriction endonuclease subunit S n=1 Tax=Streptococcus ruminicola TaxID=2686210 RepID=UPI0024141C65|nr:restriction endonuclease subunit S [Streptococcus ruminicola]WFM80918.1 restriction endonuclease subunit S [Streptococcus ruminicola]